MVRHSKISAAVLAASLALTGCLDSSSKDDNKESETSSFSFSISQPGDALATSFFERSVNDVIGFIIPKAHADEIQNIQVAIVDANGKVLQLVTPKTLTQEADGTYVVELEGGERLDCVILVKLGTEPNDIEVGDELDPKEYLFTPTVDDEEVLDINLASSIAFDLFLEEVETFDNVSPTEVDRLIEGAQELIEESGLTTASSTEELTDLITAKLNTYVETETLAATLTDEAASRNQASTGNIEGDRAKIKDFFDDVNTLAVVLPRKAEEGQEATIERLSAKVNAGQIIIEGATTTLEDFAALQSTLQAGLDGFMLGSQDVTIESIFVNDDKSNLTGFVSLTSASAQFKISGSYGVLTAVDLDFNVTIDTATNTPATIRLNGNLASPEASIEVTNGLLELHSKSPLSADILIAEKTVEQETQVELELSDKLVSLNGTLGIQLAVHQAGQEQGSFNGVMAFEVIRSNNDYTEFAGEDAQPYYNPKSLSLEGRFALGDEFISAKVSATQTNADSYVPLTQEHTEGQVSDNIVKYNYVAGESFTFYTPEYTVVETPDSAYEYKVLHVSRPYNERRFDAVLDGFDTYINGRSFYVYLENGVSFNVQGTDLIKGTIKGQMVIDESETPISYTYIEGSLDLEYERYGSLYGQSYELVSETETTITIENIDYYSRVILWADSVEDYITPQNYSVRRSDLNGEAYYSVEGSDLIKGLDQTVTATLYYSNNVEAEESIEVIYDYTDEMFDMDKEALYPQKYTFGGVEEYTGLNVMTEVDYAFGSYSYDLKEYSYSYSDYLATKGSFEAYIESKPVFNLTFDQNNYSLWVYYDSIGDVRLSPTTLEVGENAITATVLYVNSLEGYENASNFRSYDFNVEYEAQIEGLGNTKLNANVQRTGYVSGVVVLDIINTESEALSADVKLIATLNSGKFNLASISNSNGFTITPEDLTEGDEESAITFGLETATVTGTSTGIKVTYSNGEFNNY